MKIESAMHRRPASISIAWSFVAAVCAASSSGASAATSGTWLLYPPQQSSYNVSVDPPINADGTSVFKSGRGVIPVQFGLSVGPGPVVFASVQDGTPQYSFLTFTPASPVKFSDISSLIANYSFTTGDCHGGSLRWEVRFPAGSAGNQNDDSLYIYYGASPDFKDCTSSGPSTNQSGINLLTAGDVRFETDHFSGGIYYDTYAHALELLGNATIAWASLILDSGWGGTQTLTLGNVSFNDNVFVPATGSTTTCNLPPATIQVTKTEPVPAGTVTDVTSIQPSDNDANFRIVDCKYMYNLAAKDLKTGRYQVQALINGTPAGDGAFFTIK